MAKIHAAAATLALMTMGAGAAPALAQTPAALAAGNPAPTPPPTPIQTWRPGQPVVWLRSIPVDLAIHGAKAALAACKGKRASVGVVDHDGHMIVEYVDDNATMIGQKALPQKLHAAVIRQSSTQEMADHSKDSKGVAGPEIDWEAKIIDRFNDGALISPGAIPLFTGVAPNRMFVGAIGVAGASPPGAGVGIVDDDEMCARAGYEAIKDQLK